MLGDGGGGERISRAPPALPALGYWADRGRPQAGLRHAPSAAALFAFKSPKLGEGRIRGGGGDPGRGLGGDPLFWGEHRPSFFVSVPGIGGLEQWKLIQMACPGRGPGGAISELGRFVKTPGERSRRRPCSGRPPRSRRNPLALPNGSSLPPSPRLNALPGDP